MDEFSRAKGEVWASQVIERDGKFYSEKICYAMNGVLPDLGNMKTLIACTIMKMEP